MLGNLQTMDHTDNINAAGDESAQDAASAFLDSASSIHCGHVDVTVTPTDSPKYLSMGINNMHETAADQVCALLSVSLLLRSSLLRHHLCQSQEPVPGPWSSKKNVV